MAVLVTRCTMRRLLRSTRRSSTFMHHDYICCKEQIPPVGVLCASLHTSRNVAKQKFVLSSQLRCINHRLTPLSSAAFLRFNSSSATVGTGGSSSTPADSSVFINPPDYIPPVPPIPEASSVSPEMLNALSEPTLQSLGLGSYWPPGLVQQGLEALHVGLGLPWWGSIIIGTIIVRLCMFPIVIKSQKMSINMMNHMPTVQKLQVKFTQARQRGNMMEAMRYGGELGDYMKRNNVKPFGQILMPLCQLPVFLSVFVGLRSMANLPVESMKTGGMLWFPDLTVAEPLYGLPLMTALTFWMTIEAGVDGVSAQSQTHVMKWVLRAMPLIMLPVISNFPTAMLVYWFTSNSFSLTQVMFLKIPRVRKFLNIPEKTVHPVEPTEKKGFLEGFRESYSNMKASQQVTERKRLDEKSMRKAAHGPIIKTYSYNPKTVDSAQRKSNIIKLKSKS